MYRARAWLQRYGRPLEMALWEFYFERGTKEKVIRYLSAFQNKDGGFGHGLEPDFWLPSSSPMATWAAGQIVVEIRANPKEVMSVPAVQHTLVRNLVSYLVNTPQVQPGIWPSVLPENNLHPHAPWWHWEEHAQHGWMFNPSVELAALLIWLSPSDSPGTNLGWESLGHALDYVMQVITLDHHEVANYRQCLQILEPSRDQFDAKMHYSFEEVNQKVQRLTRDVIDRDAGSWGEGYSPLPLDFIQSPEDPLYPEFKELVKQNLEFYLEEKNEDGMWDLSWSWEGYPKEFAIARRYWQGILAVKRYRILRAFGWI